MDPITSAIIVGAASSLAGSVVTHLFHWLSSRTKDAHVQAVGTIVGNAAVAGAQAAAQAAVSGAKPGDIGRAAAGAAIATAAPAVLGPPSPPGFAGLICQPMSAPLTQSAGK